MDKTDNLKDEVFKEMENAKENIEDKAESTTEKFKVKGNQLVDKVKELIKEGNVKKIVIKGKDDEVLAQFPVLFGVAGAVIAPFLAVVGAVAALVTECSISVERR